ncbi:hypothetical protein KCP78_14815 [Salmonella enterica subsp. enterica]|nr:hypothetical protein KCP78_14815 [Salmonella enterica subsp. enterica]
MVAYQPSAYAPFMLSTTFKSSIQSLGHMKQANEDHSHEELLRVNKAEEYAIFGIIPKPKKAGIVKVADGAN